MNFFKRAIKNVTRRKTKSILLAVTFFLIGNLVIVGLGINNAANNAKTLTRMKMRAAVQMNVDYQSYYEQGDEIEDEEERMEYFNNAPKLDKEIMMQLIQDERVKAVNALVAQPVYSGNLDAIPMNNQADEQYQEAEQADPDGDMGGFRWIPQDLGLYGNYFPDMIEFSEKTYEMKEGRFYTQEEIDEAAPVVCITADLAEHNNLRIGDMIEVKLMSDSDAANSTMYGSAEMLPEDYTLSLEVIGIFVNHQQLDPSDERFDWMYRYESPQNRLLVPATTINEKQYNMYKKNFEMWLANDPEMKEEDMLSMEDYNVPGNVVYLLNDPLVVDEFVEDYQDSLDEFIILDAHNETFKKMARPLDTLSLFSNIIVGIVIINAVVIITLITALTLKNREYEIGVLLSLGASKMKIVAQFFVELTLVALLGFTLAVISGSLVARQVGTSVLNYQVDTENQYAEEQNEHIYYDNFYSGNYFTEVSQEELLSEYEVKISPLIIGEIYVVGLGVVFISILIPSFMIMRFNPKKILMNQN